MTARCRCGASRLALAGHACAALVALILAGCVQQTVARRAAVSPAPLAELNHASDETAVLGSARALMMSDSNAALITVDEQGRPRSRTVFTLLQEPDPNDPSAGVTAWIMTRSGSRKLVQIAQNPNVTLYFNDDRRVAYASLMGVATVHTDPDHPVARRLYTSWLPNEADRKYFWPNFPADFVMVEVRPVWVEYMGEGDHHPDTQTWRPQAVVFDRKR